MAKHIKGRQALCIGINAYPSAPLNGCIRDATNVGGYLFERGFNVSFLYDEAASRDGILGAMRGLVQGAEPNSRLVIYYSGHGTYLPDLNGDEGDRYDEALVPCDYHTGAFVLDDDLFAVFNELPSYASLTFISDSCFGGTATRFFAGMPTAPDGGRARYLVPTTQMRVSHTAFRADLGPTPRMVAESALRWANLSMCLPTEVAYEDVQEDGTVAGTGTTSMLRVLRASGSSLTLAGLRTRMVTDLGAHRSQTPYLDAGPKHATRTIVGGNPR